MPRISNPVLPGSHPDPSILRVGEDYYIATSTFEWLPGVQLHHSRDLCHWRLLGHVLTRPSQLDLRGAPDSGGVWAPCLSHDGALYYLTYPVVLERRWPLVNCLNYVVTAADIQGPWSEPAFLNGSGWDPSLFHDDDGRTWLVNHLLDSRKPDAAMAGIQLQEYSARERRLLGAPRLIFEGSRLCDVEGPHLYKRGGLYYLMLASGGTGWNHAVSLARSNSIEGPYELAPSDPILTSRGDPGATLQRVGHGSLVETTSGEWFLAHLASRPISPLTGGDAPKRYSLLGRETLLTRVAWRPDGWLHATGVEGRAELELPGPSLPEVTFRRAPVRDHFDAASLNPAWNTLREWPSESWLSLQRRPGKLSLRGRALFNSRFDQSLVARRLQSFRVRVQTCVELEPVAVQEMAGLICIYDTADCIYLHVGFDAQLGKIVELLRLDGSRLETVGAPVKVNSGPLHLRAELADARLTFAFSSDGSVWVPIGAELDATQLSDEYRDKFGFTGAFVGLCAQDPAQQASWADFDYFDYEEQG